MFHAWWKSKIVEIQQKVVCKPIGNDGGFFFFIKVTILEFPLYNEDEKVLKIKYCIYTSIIVRYEPHSQETHEIKFLTLINALKKDHVLRYFMFEL